MVNGYPLSTLGTSLRPKSVYEANTLSTRNEIWSMDRLHHLQFFVEVRIPVGPEQATALLSSTNKMADHGRGAPREMIRRTTARPTYTHGSGHRNPSTGEARGADLPERRENIEQVAPIKAWRYIPAAPAKPGGGETSPSAPWSGFNPVGTITAFDPRTSKGASHPSRSDSPLLPSHSYLLTSTIANARAHGARWRQPAKISPPP